MHLGRCKRGYMLTVTCIHCYPTTTLLAHFIIVAFNCVFILQCELLTLDAYARKRHIHHNALFVVIDRTAL